MVFTENKNNKNIKNNGSNQNSESSKNNKITDKLDFIEYSASRYGIEIHMVYYIANSLTFLYIFNNSLLPFRTKPL